MKKTTVLFDSYTTYTINTPLIHLKKNNTYINFNIIINFWVWLFFTPTRGFLPRRRGKKRQICEILKKVPGSGFFHNITSIQIISHIIADIYYLEHHFRIIFILKLMFSVFLPRLTIHKKILNPFHPIIDLVV